MDFQLVAIFLNDGGHCIVVVEVGRSTPGGSYCVNTGCVHKMVTRRRQIHDHTCFSGFPLIRGQAVAEREALQRKDEVAPISCAPPTTGENKFCMSRESKNIVEHMRS